MYNNSPETLLLRHYGEQSPVPEALEQRLVAAVRQESTEISRTEALIARLCEQRISRRRAVRWVALGSAGLGALSTGISGVQSILSTSDGNRPAYAS